LHSIGQRDLDTIQINQIKLTIRFRSPLAFLD